MARGWESKSVEDQVADAEAAKEARAKRQLSEQEREKLLRRQSLLMSRAQISDRLKKATNARYRAQLELALKDLEDRLRDSD
ncbi:MAG TPA: hypothetical protein VJT71_05640 [Pyrinomonadaceae bacterium]|nr:hypothetical protein [Pyrinomonadaceae bacterium]